VEHIHRRYAFKAARRATVSRASTFNTRVKPSAATETFARSPTCFLTSGVKAFKTASSCLFDPKGRRTIAFDFNGGSRDFRSFNDLKIGSAIQRNVRFFKAFQFFLTCFEEEEFLGRVVAVLLSEL
jgi:hypothetical protein